MLLSEFKQEFNKNINSYIKNIEEQKGLRNDLKNLILKYFENKNIKEIPLNTLKEDLNLKQNKQVLLNIILKKYFDVITRKKDFVYKRELKKYLSYKYTEEFLKEKYQKEQNPNKNKYSSYDLINKIYNFNKRRTHIKQKSFKICVLKNGL